jgi:hypothetical protein
MLVNTQLHFEVIRRILSLLMLRSRLTDAFSIFSTCVSVKLLTDALGISLRYPEVGWYRSRTTLTGLGSFIIESTFNTFG